MAIASVGTLGTGVSSTSNSSFTLSTATNTLASGDFGILTVVTDNIATADGNTSNHTSVSGGTGTWSKLGEYTNTVGGVAGDGVCTSVWLFSATGAVGTGTTVTINLSGNATDKAASFWKFTKAAGTEIAVDSGPTNNGVDGTNGFGSVSFASLPSKSRLYFRGLGKEANSTTALTVSTSFTQITNTRSRNNAAAVGVWGEFRVNTSTGETSNPTLAVTGDTAGVFLALAETNFEAPAAGSATLTGQTPTRLVDSPVTPSAGSSALTGFAPAVIMGFVAATGAGSISTQSTGWVAPKIETAVNTGGGDGGLLLGLNTLLSATQNYTVNPTTGAISVTGQTPTRLVDSPVTPAVGAISLTGQTPTRLVDSPVTPSAGALSVTGQTPLRLVDSPVTPSVVSLAFTGYQPSVNGAGATTPSAGSVSFTGYAP